MKVLVLGMPRTGTTSLKAALEVLNIGPVYHGLAAFLDNPDHSRLWYDGMLAKYHSDSSKSSLDRKFFDQMLQNYEALSATPAIGLAEELVDAYPEAKVILTNRNVDKWHTSVSATLHHNTFSPKAYIGSSISQIFFSPSRWLRPLAVELFDHCLGRDFDKTGRQNYENHYQRMRQKVPKDRLLEFGVEEGWEPLCRFLKVEVPKTRPFPRVNETAEFGRQSHKIFLREVVRMLSILVALAILVMALQFAALRQT